MVTRIRYSKSGDTLIASKPIMCGTSLYEVEISVNNTTARITEVKSKAIPINLQAGTISGLKKIVKERLKLLGATFGEEIRNKGKTRKIEV